jgi:class 3 adenylate cyclase/predicted ATPase
MQQIADWLERLGMSEYAQCFAENRIDFSVLRYLTDQDLKDIGVPLGHRRVMLAAIAKSAGVAATTPEPAPQIEAKVEESAERRQVTVMFSDLVGSTALSARMDPEDLRDVISGYQKCVAETVRRFDGFVSRYLGDGVLVYFGYPLAHEDDAERAVRAGLELIAAVSGMKTCASLRTRVGIATGLVIIGDLRETGEGLERDVVGETPNLAARLQSIAEPNTVVIAEGTRRLLGNLFELDDLGVRELKGIPEPTRLWAVLRVSSVESRFEALHGSGLTALVGREEEFELLLRRWARAKTGEGQLVLLSGEAGIGKSRLTVALLERLATEPHTRLRYFCSPQHTESALYPIITRMERAAAVRHDDTAQAKLDKLDALLAHTATPPQDAALFAEMLSIPDDGRYPELRLDPQQRRQRTLEAFVLQLQALSRSNPVLMIFEDVHWADPTSLELLGRTIARIRTCRVMLIVTFRPEFNPPWIGWPYVTVVTINRLADRDVSAMIEAIAGNKLIPASIRQDIVERADGIPLFIEEMTKAVLEAETRHGAERAITAAPSAAHAVPAALHASLMARLDRLGPAKEVAQIAAAMGREFSHALLAAVVRKPEPELAWALDRLIAAGLLFRQGMPPHASYLFKHALVQDAAYSTLLRESRRALHARIAETLEHQFAEIAESQPELLARHCTEAGLIEKAASLWGKAGHRSLARSASVEAIEQLTRALGQIADLPATPALRREQIKFQAALITPLIHVKGYAAPETRAAAERARLLIEQAEALGEPPEDPLLLFSVLYGFWTANFAAFQGDVVGELAARFMALAEKQGTGAALLIAHRVMGMSLVGRGEIAQGRAHLDRAVAIYDPVEHRPLVARFGQDIGVTVLCYRAHALWCLGHAEAALADVDRASRDASEIGQAATLIYALFHRSFIRMHCGNYAAASVDAEEFVALADEKDSWFWKAFGMTHRGCLCALTGKSPDAVQMITSGIAALRSSGSTMWSPFNLSFLAMAHADLGHFDDAWRSIVEAMTAVGTTKERWCEAEVHRMAGEIAHKSAGPDTDSAEAHFERALAVAREQHAKSWELRAAISMARLRRDQGKCDAARDLLAAVYGSFTEGLDTLDLKQAKALLDDLA